MNRLLISAFFIIAALSLSKAQTLVKGKITDKDTNEPLIGAVISLEDSQVSTITDADGVYNLIIPFTPRLSYKLLEVRYVGYDSTDDFIEINNLDSLVTVVKNFQLVSNNVILDDVIITANKVEEELQDVPIATSVINSDQLTQQTVSSTFEALESVPNLVTDSYLPHQSTISLRGLATNFTNSGVENEVGLYVDEVYQARSFSFNSTLMDIKRVEVLRGPQGTLFGKNTVGGVLHVVSQEPEMNNNSVLELTAGNLAYLQVRAKTNIVLAEDKMALRLVGAYKRRNGWIREQNPELKDANGVNFYGGRASLLYQPNDKIKISVKGDLGHDDKADFTVDYQTPPTGDPINLEGIEDRDGFNRSVNQDAADVNFSRTNGSGSVRGEIQLDDKHTLTSISAYNYSTSSHYRDFDVLPVDVGTFLREADMNTFSQEIRISTPRQNQKVFYLAGLYFLDERIDSRDSVAIHEGFLPIYDAILPPEQFPDGLQVPAYEESMVATSTTRAQSYAAFAAGSIEVSERVRVNAGLRYTIESRKLDYWQQIYSFAPTPAWIQALAVNYGSREEPVRHEVKGRSAAAFSGNIGMDFKTTEKALFYINLSRGFKGAGFNVSLNRFLTEESFIFKPEFLNSYEFGVKAKFNKQFRWNTAAFVMDYRNKQEAVTVGSGVFIYNAESAQGLGIESEFSGVWNKGFRLDAAIGAMRLRYYSFPVFDFFGNKIDDLSGNRMFKAPEFTAKISPEYSTDIGNDLNLRIRADYNFVGKTYNDIFNTEFIARQATGILNGRITFSIQEGKYSLALWGKNLTNETFIQHGWEYIHGGHISVNPPRLMGLELRVGFY